MNLYGVWNFTCDYGSFIAAESEKDARRIVHQDLQWQYWDMSEAVLLSENVAGSEGRVEAREGFSLLRKDHV